MEGLRFAQQPVYTSEQMWALEGLAWLAAQVGVAQGQRVEGARRAARLFGAAEAWRATSGETLSLAEHSGHERYVAIAHAHLDEATWNAAWAEGWAMPLEQAVAYAREETVDA